MQLNYAIYATIPAVFQAHHSEQAVADRIFNWLDSQWHGPHKFDSNNDWSTLGSYVNNHLVLTVHCENYQQVKRIMLYLDLIGCVWYTNYTEMMTAVGAEGLIGMMSNE